MVYLAGDNNLSAEMVYSLLEMRKAPVGPNEDVVVLAQFDPQGEDIPTQRFIINKNHKPGAGPERVRPGGNGFHAMRSAMSLADDARRARDVAKAKDGEILPELVKIVAQNPDAFPTLAPTVTSDPSQIQQLAKFPFNGSRQKAVELLRAIADPLLTDDTGNPWTLLRFLFWGINTYQAENYMLALSGHGSGAVGDFLKDDSSEGSLTVRGLAEVLKILQMKLGKPLDILGLDSCLMSMTEVYYQVRGSVTSLIGSEGVSPNAGWPYREVLELFTNPPAPDLKPQDYARLIVDEYEKFYLDYALGGVSADIAACDAGEDKVKKLEESVLALSEELIKQLKDEKTKTQVADAILAAHWTAQTYKFDQYVDLKDFCQELANRRLGNLSDLAQKVADVIIGDIVMNAAQVGPLFQYSYGLSVYFPWARVSDEYSNLCFASKTKWADFLELYVENVSRRPPRCRCGSTGNAVLNDVFNPKRARAGAPRILSPATGRAEDPCKHSSTRFTAPCDRGPGGAFLGVKNPPLDWCPGRKGELNTKVIVKADPEPPKEIGEAYLKSAVKQSPARQRPSGRATKIGPKR